MSGLPSIVAIVEHCLTDHGDDPSTALNGELIRREQAIVDGLVKAAGDLGLHIEIVREVLAAYEMGEPLSPLARQQIHEQYEACVARIQAEQRRRSEQN